MFILHLKRVFKIVCFCLLAYLAKISIKMPLSKATKYKRFSVCTYMKETRIASQQTEARNKTLIAKRKQLSRIEKKVRRHKLIIEFNNNSLKISQKYNSIVVACL